MAKVQVTHLRFGDYKRICCSYLISIDDDNINWTDDWHDTTCNNCIRTRKYKQIAADFPNGGI